MAELEQLIRGRERPQVGRPRGAAGRLFSPNPGNLRAPFRCPISAARSCERTDRSSEANQSVGTADCRTSAPFASDMSNGGFCQEITFYVRVSTH